VLTLSQAISYITHNPAELAGIKAGTLSAGQPADLSIFDPEYFWQLDPTDMISEGKNSPFTGWGFNGKTTQTFVKGKTVFSL
jgi:dihydroorotase